MHSIRLSVELWLRQHRLDRLRRMTDRSIRVLQGGGRRRPHHRKRLEELEVEIAMAHFDIREHRDWLRAELRRLIGRFWDGYAASPPMVS